MKEMPQCLFIPEQLMDLTLHKILLLLSHHSCTEVLISQGFSQSSTPVLRPHTWETAPNCSNSTNEARDKI